MRCGREILIFERVVGSKKPCKLFQICKTEKPGLPGFATHGSLPAASAVKLLNGAFAISCKYF
jgi:hypothetical protein